MSASNGAHRSNCGTGEQLNQGNDEGNHEYHQGRGRRTHGRFRGGGSSRGSASRARYKDYVYKTNATDDLAMSDGVGNRFEERAESGRNDNYHYDTRPKRGNRRGGHGNWRQQKRQEMASADNVSDSLSEVTDDTREAPQGDMSLNVQAEPFVPKSFSKPNPAKNMTKLGKVKQHRRRGNIGPEGTPTATDEKVTNQSTARRQPARSAPVSRDKTDALNLVKQFTGTETEAHLQGTEGKPRNNDTRGAPKQFKKKDTQDIRQGQRNSAKQISRAQANIQQRDNSNVGHQTETDQPTQRERYWNAEEAKEKALRAERQAALHSFKERKPLNPQTFESHREHLIESLMNSSYECTICYGAINQEAAIWSCGKCYHMFHFYCLKKWANTLISQQSEAGQWRCPTCQDKYKQIPNQYRCFCGQVRDPVWNKHDTPHSCGEMCGRKREDNCSHQCNELCHPGPCPPCNAYISKHCNCRRSYQKVKCSKQVGVKCAQTCNKLKNCSIHPCDVVCHSGNCSPCDQTVIQDCHCGEAARDIICGSTDSRMSGYCCGKICDKPLACGNHTCKQPCHAGSCAPCVTAPEVVLTCNCGKSMLADMKDENGGAGIMRKSCQDDIPSCGRICGKQLNCGGSQVHTCLRQCHTGDCECKLTTQVTCRCKVAKKKILPCSEAVNYTTSNPFKCEKKCTRMRSCGRHKCGQPCCIAGSHLCMQICGKRLSCGLHKCMELCHIGNCPTCQNISYDELHCTCGIAVTYPPIACGTPRPACHEMCTRAHTCDHPVVHYCHAEESCPACVVLTTKLCMGGHELRNNIPCHITEISCGRRCEKTLPCGDHKCPKTCHKLDCGNEVCRQSCTKRRQTCGHPCGAECHPHEDCPATDCKYKVSLKCACGRREERILCYMTAKRLSVAAMTLKMKELNTGINMVEMMNAVDKKQLECDEECAQVERNRRMATALDIMNPELLESLAGPQFTDFLKDTARRNPSFIAEVEKAICDLVKSAQQSKQEMRSHVFAPMKKFQRQAVHELAELYGCGSISYDEEPQRNVVVMAHRGKCSLPSQTLTAFIQSEKHPRPPVPIPLAANEEQIRLKSQEAMRSTVVKPEENKIDYFDMT